jgi:hypothetical protein
MSKFQEAMRNPKLSSIARKAMCECAYACLGMALFEGPHVSLEYDPIAHTEIPWDFYDERPEGRNGQWLMQLVTLFRDGEMDNVVMLNGNRVPTHYDMRSGDERRILKILLDDNYFHLVAGTDYPKLSDADRFLVDLWVPEELLQKIRENVK